MINIKELKKGDIFYESHPNGVIKWKVYSRIDKKGYVEVVSWNSYLSIWMGSYSFSEKDSINLFYTSSDAKRRRRELPNEMTQELCLNDKWIKELFAEYKRNNSKAYNDAMRKAIRIKLGIRL